MDGTVVEGNSSNDSDTRHTLTVNVTATMSDVTFGQAA